MNILDFRLGDRPPDSGDLRALFSRIRSPPDRGGLGQLGRPPRPQLCRRSSPVRQVPRGPRLAQGLENLSHQSSRR